MSLEATAELVMEVAPGPLQPSGELSNFPASHHLLQLHTGLLMTSRAPTVCTALSRELGYEGGWTVCALCVPIPRNSLAKSQSWTWHAQSAPGRG